MAAIDIFFVLIVLLFTIIPAVIIFSHQAKAKAAQKPGFLDVPILGTLPGFIRNRHRFLDWITDILADSPANTSVFYRPGKPPTVVTAFPANVEHVLKTNFDNYIKGGRFIPFFRDFLGDGIFNSDGDVWKTQRSIALHEFNTKTLRRFVMDTATVHVRNRLIPGLEKKTTDDNTTTTVDLQDVLERFSFDNVCKLAFDVDPLCLSAGDSNANIDFMKAFDLAAMLCFRRAFYLCPFVWKLKRLLNLGSEKTLNAAITRVHKFADKIISTRMETNKVVEEGHDLLTRFMNKEEYSPDFLRFVVVNFILAGKDTTASVLSWFFWLLASAPHAEAKILNELEVIRPRRGRDVGDDAYTFDDLKKMNYLHAALSETMRLHPPVAVDTKECLNDDVLPDGTRVTKGSGVMYSAYAMGRMKSLWGKDWPEFRPERWFDESGGYRQESQFRYPVFNAGPRTCPGMELSYMQMKLIAASVLERFKVEVVDKDTLPETSLSIVHKMKYGLRVKVHERNTDIAYHY